MKISVIIPAYNSEAYLAETLDCLLSQTLKDIQIIVVNDGSTDGTGRIIEEYAKKSDKILPVFQQNAGVSAARNNGIEKAEGEYTFFLDSDDLLSQNALESICNSLDETGSDLAICRIETFGMGGNAVNPIVEEIAKENSIDCYDKRLLWNFLLGNKCFRTDLIKKHVIRFSPVKYSEDGVFIMQFIHTAKPRITGVHNAVFRYRRHSLSVTQRVNTPLMTDFSTAMKSVYSCAEGSFEDHPEKKEEYLQEILRKSYSALINEFYRMLWAAEDEEALAFMGKFADELISKMNSETKKACLSLTQDMDRLCFSKAEIAEKPMVTVIAKQPTEEFLSSLYKQTMPVFELITAENSAVMHSENTVIIPEKAFRSEAKKKAKGKITLTLKGNEKLDSRLLKVISHFKNSKKIGFLPNFIIIQGAYLFLKLK